MVSTERKNSETYRMLMNFLEYIVKDHVNKYGELEIYDDLKEEEKEKYFTLTPEYAVDTFMTNNNLK